MKLSFLAGGIIWLAMVGFRGVLSQPAMLSLLVLGMVLMALPLLWFFAEYVMLAVRHRKSSD